LAAVAVALACAAPAHAQAPTPKGDLGAPEAEPSQQPWLLDCGEQEGFSLGKCRLLQTIVIKETGQPLLTAAMEQRPGNAGYSLVLKVPHGILLTPGMALEVDGIDRMVLKYRLSDATGVFAATIVTDKLLGAMKKGDALKVSVVTANGQKVGIPVTLRGFTDAFNKLNTP
jgi:invasion protein IalB